MRLDLELVRDYVAEFVSSRIEDLAIDTDSIANTTAISMISEIQSILKDSQLDDFNAIEEIVCVFEKHGVDCGERHDFG